MRRALLAMVLFGLCAAAAPEPPPAPNWSEENVVTLERWAASAPRDALPQPSTAALDAASAAGDGPLVDRLATEWGVDTGSGTRVWCELATT